ncbi:MAG: TetR/AcrR family transcriptional regulator [Anaerolineales bacterium]|nr:MAG: TetR/AcrR family transcriptional regulator [Anaerolineales bacterium]
MNSANSSPNPDKTRNRIMDAASRLFSEKGFSGTTTRAIANEAGINEVTLFRHFGSKENLARAIMDQFGGLAIAENITALLSGDYRQDLLLIGSMMLKVMTERNDAMRMAICEAGHFPEFQDIGAENPRQLRLMLSRYFEDQMKNGHIHRGHPELLAQAFLGMFFSYTVLQGFLMDQLQPEVTPEEIVNQFVDLFIRGTIKGEA